MLYTANYSAVNHKGNLKVYYLKEGFGNDAVSPDQKDLAKYYSNAITWKGMKMNYMAKLMRKDADDWMKKVAEEVLVKDVVIIDDEKDVENSFRKILAELMASMFGSSFRFKFAGELDS